MKEEKEKRVSEELLHCCCLHQKAMKCLVSR